VNSSTLQVAIALAQAVALLMSVAFISYAFVIVIPYLRSRPSRAGDGAALDWHLFVPALNEERVISGTIDYLRATFPRAHVWVIDDDSEDGTASIVGMRAWADPMVHLVRRYRPQARTGKGDALNAAYLALDAWLPVTADAARTIIGVVDADGRPPTASTYARAPACSATRSSVQSRCRCGC
jgi:1,2-diacylglycerol 3-beta-glucosyltransferase